MPDRLSSLYDPQSFEAGVPLDLLAELRSERELIWVDERPLPHWPSGEGFWLVLSHAAVVEVMKSPERFSSALGGTQLRNPQTTADLAYVRRMMLNMDPPEHSRLRRLLVSTFSSSAMSSIKQGIQSNAAAIVARVAGGAAQGQCDFAKEIAADLPLLSLADILGMPSEDRYLMYDWANRVIGFQDPEYRLSSSFDTNSGSDIARKALQLRPLEDANGHMPDPRTRAGMPDLYRYAHLLAENKRQQPGDDLMSLLLTQVDEDGGKVSLEEFENLFWLFAVAGNETLRNGIPGGMIALLQNPTAIQRLREDPELMANAVEEMLRWWTPVMMFRRTASENTVLAGQRVNEGEKVVVSFLSANYDSAVFERPEEFDIERAPNPHLAFGYGPHFCLGAQLARIQMRALFTEVLNRFQRIEADGNPSFLRSNFQRGVKRLPVRWYR